MRRGRYSEILCKANPELKLYCVDPWAPIDNKYPGERQQEIYNYTVNRLKPYNATIIRRQV